MPWSFADFTMAWSGTAVASPAPKAGWRKTRQAILDRRQERLEAPVLAPLSAISLTENRPAFISMAQWRGPLGPRDLLRHLSACNHITNRLKEAGPGKPESWV
jgi:hypothetical protein